MHGHDWPVLESETTFECPFFDVGYDLVERPNGDNSKYYWVDPWDGVSIVAQTPSGELVLVEEYRPRHGRSFLSFPKGGVEDEGYLEAARRELEEETGWIADHLEEVIRYHSSGWLRQTRAVVYATDLTKGEQSLEDGEYLEVRTRSPAAAFELLEEAPVPGWTLVPLLVVADAGLI